MRITIYGTLSCLLYQTSLFVMENDAADNFLVEAVPVPGGAELRRHQLNPRYIADWT